MLGAPSSSVQLLARSVCRVQNTPMSAMPTEATVEALILILGSGREIGGMEVRDDEVGVCVRVRPGTVRTEDFEDRR